MARTPWQGETQQAQSSITANADYASLLTATHVSVTEASEALGGNRQLAVALLMNKGTDLDTMTRQERTRAINSQMRSIQRWENYERGVTGKQAHKPSAAARAMINTEGKLATSQINTQGGIDVHISGPVTIEGYERERTLTIHMTEQQSQKWLANPTFEGLAKAYGVGELHTYSGTTLQVL